MRQKAAEQYAALNWAISLLIVCLGLVGCGGEAEQPAESSPETTPAPPDAPAGESSVRPEDIVSALSAAESYLASGETTEAEAVVAVLVDRAPGDARAREMYGRVKLALATDASISGDMNLARQCFAEAYVHYRAATELEPESAGLQQSAGEIAHTAGLLPEALQHYRAAGLLSPLDLRPPLYEAQVLIAMERLGEAETALQRALAIDPDEPTIHGSLAVIAMEREDYAGALGHIGQARRISPEDLRFRVQEARIHRRAGKPRKALELLVNLSDMERTGAAVTYEIAVSYEMLDEFSRAAEAWEHRCRRAPDAPDAGSTAARAGMAYLSAGQREEAWSWLQRARLLDPEAEEVLALEKAMREKGQDDGEAPGR